MATEHITAVCSATKWGTFDTSTKTYYNDTYYLTLAAWEADYGGTTGNLVTDDKFAVAEIFTNETYDLDRLDFVGWTCDTTPYIVIRGASGNEINPNTLAGAQMTSTGSAGYVYLLRSGAKLLIEDCGLITSNATALGYMQGIDITFNRVVLKDLDSAVIQLGNTSTNYISNSLVINEGGTSARFTAFSLYNVTGLNLSASTDDILYINCVCYNVIGYNERTKTTFSTFHACSGDYNAQNDNGSASPPGSNSISTVTDTGTFNDYTNDDYHLASDSTVCSGTGLNLIDSGDLPSPQYDIDNDEWPGASGGAWDIGFDYYVDAGGEPTTVNDSYSVTDGVQKVVTVPGILTNDTYDCT